MARHFSATILLARPWPLDIEGLADLVAGTYPEIGRIEGVAGHGDGREAGLLHIDGGHVIVTSSGHPVPAEALSPELPLLRRWVPDQAIARHAAHMTISCGGSLPGLDGAMAYAAAVHFVAAAVAGAAPALAVLWHQGNVISAPGSFVEGAAVLLKGGVPLDLWVGFAKMVPRGFDPARAMGMVSFGLRPFLGRELELSPRPGNAAGAWREISGVARCALAGSIDLADRQRIDRIDGVGPLTVRSRNYWLRRDLSAFVLVSDDAIVDAETLRPRAQSVA